MNDQQVQDWLDRYVDAWRANDGELVRRLFSEDAVYFENPFRAPKRGIAEILRYWEESGDPPDMFEAHYAPLAVAGNLAVASGYSRYFNRDRRGVRKEYGNVFVLRFGDDGRVKEYREWYMLKGPEESRPADDG